MKQILDVLFPPLCLACKARCKTKFFCKSCWKLCELPDPASRCRLCFSELEKRHGLCRKCRKEPPLQVQRAYVFDPSSPARLLGVERETAMASFAVCQWIKLNWLCPDAVIAMPDEKSTTIGYAFANMLNVHFVKALNFRLQYVEDRLEDEQILLLFDVLNSAEHLRKAIKELGFAVPKKVYILSLFPDVDPI